MPRAKETRRCVEPAVIVDALSGKTARAARPQVRTGRASPLSTRRTPGPSTDGEVPYSGFYDRHQRAGLGAELRDLLTKGAETSCPSTGRVVWPGRSMRCFNLTTEVGCQGAGASEAGGGWVEPYLTSKNAWNPVVSSARRGGPWRTQDSRLAGT